MNERNESRCSFSLGSRVGLWGTGVGVVDFFFLFSRTGKIAAENHCVLLGVSIVLCAGFLFNEWKDGWMEIPLYREAFAWLVLISF